jgi:hypothetical protein
MFTIQNVDVTLICRKSYIMLETTIKALNKNSGISQQKLGA